MWIRPLLPIKLRFMAAYSVILCEDSSSTLWIRPLFLFVVVLSTVQGRFVYPAYRRFVSIVFIFKFYFGIIRKWLRRLFV